MLASTPLWIKMILLIIALPFLTAAFWFLVQAFIVVSLGIALVVVEGIARLKEGISVGIRTFKAHRDMNKEE